MTKKSSKFEVAREVWEITELRDGEVYATRWTGETIWIDYLEADHPPEGVIYATPSPHRFPGRTIRLKGTGK